LCPYVSNEETIGLLDLSHFYLEEKLKQKCIDIIANELTVENVCPYYLSALKYKSQKLQDICIEFKINNLFDVYITKPFQQMNESFQQLVSKKAKILCKINLFLAIFKIIFV
jgi:hypothetical protein